MSEKCLILLLHHEQLQIPLAVWGHQCCAKLCRHDVETIVSYYSSRQGLCCFNSGLVAIANVFILSNT